MLRTRNEPATSKSQSWHVAGSVLEVQCDVAGSDAGYGDGRSGSCFRPRSSLTRPRIFSVDLLFLMLGGRLEEPAMPLVAAA